MACYYGFYSNVSCVKREKAAVDDQIPCIVASELSSSAFRKNWARLIQKIYEVDPLLCPKCTSQMRVIAFAEDGEVIRKILKHLGLWDVKRLPVRGTQTGKIQVCAHGPPIFDVSENDEPSASSAAHCISDPDYPTAAS